MLKNYAKYLFISLVIALSIYMFKIIGERTISDVFFLVGLIYLTLGLFSMLNGLGTFNTQKYAFKRFMKSAPYYLRIFVPGNTYNKVDIDDNDNDGPNDNKKKKRESLYDYLNDDSRKEHYGNTSFTFTGLTLIVLSFLLQYFI